MGLPKEKHALPQKEVSPPSKEVCKHTPSQPSKAVVENAPLIHPSHFKLPGCFRPEDSESLSTGTPVSNIVLKYFHFSFSVRFYHSQNYIHRDFSPQVSALWVPFCACEPETNLGFHPPTPSLHHRHPSPFTSLPCGPARVTCQAPCSHPRRHQLTDSQNAKSSIIPISSLHPVTARETKGAEKDSLVTRHSTSINGTIMVVHLQHRENQPIMEC